MVEKIAWEDNKIRGGLNMFKKYQQHIKNTENNNLKKLSIQMKIHM